MLRTWLAGEPAASAVVMMMAGDGDGRSVGRWSVVVAGRHDCKRRDMAKVGSCGCCLSTEYVSPGHREQHSSTEKHTVVIHHRVFTGPPAMYVHRVRVPARTLA